MSLRRAVSVPFRQRGVETLSESEFVVALSLDRDWYTADQAKHLVSVATSEGLLDDQEGTLAPTFEVSDVTVPEDFEPGDSILQERSTFERVLERLVDAGIQKQTAVGDINRLQSECGVSVEAAALLYAKRQNVAMVDIGDELLRGN